MISAVVFDMDGVLFDTERMYKRAWMAEAARLGLKNMDYVHKGACGLNHHDSILWLKKNFGETFDAEAFLSKINSMFSRDLVENGLPLKIGTHEILDWLKERSIPMAICSSTKVPVIQEHLDQTNLNGYFDQIIGGNMVTHSKPQPDIYIKACEALNKDPKFCLAVEDSPNGIRSAYAANMPTVMIPDIVDPTDELLAMCYRKEESLLTLLEFLKNTIPQKNDVPV